MSKLQKLEKALLFLALLFLPTQLGKHFWPEFSFIYSLPIDYLSPTFYFWDILVLLIWVVFLLQGKHINKTAMNFFYFFILSQSLSLQSFGVGLVRLEQYLIAGLFGVYISSLDLDSNKKTIFLGLALPVIFESFLAFGQFINGRTLGFWILGERTFTLSTPGIAKFDFRGIQLLRPYATFPHPNVLAGYMVVMSLLLNIFQKKTKLPFFVLTAVTTLLTVSRTAILSLFIFSFILFKKKGRMLLVLSIFFLLPFLYTRYSSLLSFDSLTLTRRGELFSNAITLWSHSPFLGIGLNNFIFFGSDLLLSGPSRFLQPVHNIFLLSLSETGVIGFIGLTVLIGYPLIKTRKSPLLYVWVVIIFLGLFDHYFLTLAQGYRLLFLVWGLSFSMLEYFGGHTRQDI